MPLHSRKMISYAWSLIFRKKSFTEHQHLYKQPSCHLVKSLKREMEKLNIKCVFAPANKAGNNVIIIWQRYYVDILQGDWILREHMYKLSRRKTQFFCIISILSITQMWQLINVNCLDVIGCQRYINIRTNLVSNLILATALLPFFLSIIIASNKTAVKDHIIRYYETALRNSNVNYVWFMHNSSEVIEKLRQRNIEGSQVSSCVFSFLFRT